MMPNPSVPEPIGTRGASASNERNMLSINGVMLPPVESDSAPGAAAMERVYAELQQLETSNLEWYAQFDDCDLMQSGQKDLAHLLETAPCAMAQGFIAGVMAMRVHIASMTMRPLI
jgi:hypothetical protein